MDTNTAQQYEVLLENTPEKIREFLWSDAFLVLVKSIAKPYKLTESQIDALKDVIFDIIIGYNNEADSKNKLTEAGIPQSNQEKLFALAYDYIIEPILETAKTPSLQDLSEETDTVAETITIEPAEEPPSQPQDTVLQNITQRLQKTTVIAPSKRSHTIERTSETKTSHTDPYREIPE